MNTSPSANAPITVTLTLAEWTCLGAVLDMACELRPETVGEELLATIRNLHLSDHFVTQLNEATAAPLLDTEKLLVVSTSHLPQAEMLKIDRLIVFQSIVGYSRDVGAMVSATPENLEAINELGLSYLAALVEKAQTTGHEWLLLDRDGPVLESFTHFTW